MGSGLGGWQFSEHWLKEEIVFFVNESDLKIVLFSERLLEMLCGVDAAKNYHMFAR